MQCFCCRPSRKVLATSDDSQKLQDLSAKSDLIHDEGANIQQDLWQLTVKQRINDAKAFDNDNVLGHATFESSLEDLRDRYIQNGQKKWLPIVDKLLKGIQPFIQGLQP